MADPFLGQVIMFGGNFAPRGWAQCEGQLLPISQYQALFSLLGTIYGGDGRTTFALPDLRGRVPIGNGNGPGLTPRDEGQRMGTETNTLNATQLPSHSHTVAVQVNSAAANKADPTGNFLANSESYNSAGETGKVLGGTSAGNTGEGQSVNNVQPSLVINYIIALQGTFPSRN